MPIGPEAAKAKSDLMVAFKRADTEAIEAARRHLREAVAADKIRQLVDQAPPLSSETRSRLAVLLLGAAS